MKVTFIRTVLLATAALLAFASCNPEKEETVSVSLSASSAMFTDGKVDLTVSLSAKASADVTATLTADGSIPAGALSYNGSVTIPAGETSAKVPVTVKTDDLAAGSYNVTFTLASANGAQVDAANNTAFVALVVEMEPEPMPVVSISSNDDEFQDNVATLTLAMDVAINTDVTVKFASSAVEGYAEIPAEALSYDNPVTIAAGETSKVVSISLDPDKLPSGECWTMISIESVSENATMSGQNSAYFMAKGEIKTELVPDWTLTYVGREKSTQGSLLDWVQVEGWTGEYYDIALYEGGTLASVDGDVSVIMLDRHENFVGKYLGDYKIDDLLRSAPTYCGFNLLDPGTYEVFLFDYTSDGNLTGKYTMNEFSIEEEEASEEYKALLGVYNLSAKGYHTEYVDSKATYLDGEVNMEGVYVLSNVNNLSYLVYFPEWDEDDQKNYFYPAIVDWDAETGAMSASVQKLDDWDHSTYGKVEDWQYGYIYEPKDAKIYYVTGNYTILESEGFKDGAITFNAGPAINLTNGSTYEIAGLDLVGALIEYQGGGYSFTYMQVPFPATLTRVSDLPEKETESVATAARLASFERPQVAVRSAADNSGKVAFNALRNAVRK